MASANDPPMEKSERITIDSPDKDEKEGAARRLSAASSTLGQSEDEPFAPLLGVAPYDGRRLVTIRAIVTGGVLGSLIACSNLYLGLKSGFGADATLFSAIFGFGICKMLEKSNIPFLGGDFGPHENNIIQATSLGCIGVGFMFMSGVPAMYQLKLLGPTPQSDYGRMLCLTLVGGFWGLGFAVPLRRLFILKLARQLSLNFPLGTASAFTIRALHAATGEAAAATEKIKTIAISFSASLVWSVGSAYAPGILYQWNPFWWIYKWGGTSIIGAVNWGWLSWQWSPSLIGMGMLIDLNASLSYVFGTVLAWGIIGPILVAKGEAVGVPSDPTNPDLVTYNAFVPDQFLTSPSPRYWILWPAVFTMLASSIATIALESNNFAKLGKYGLQRMHGKFTQSTGKRLFRSSSSSGSVLNHAPVLGELEIPDPVSAEHQVRWWEWSSITIAGFVFAMVALKCTFGVPPTLILLNVFLGFLWALVVIQVFGASGTNPTGSVAKGSQFITGAVSRDHVANEGFNHAARSNLLLGTCIAVFLSPALFLLFARAFPCITDASATTCQFALPSVTAWRVITEAILAPKIPISQSSWVCSVIMAVISMGMVLLKRFLAQSTNTAVRKYAVFVPNMSLVGLSMATPGTMVSLTIGLGSVASWVWKKRWPASHGRFVYAVASGGIAGEGIGNVVQSILQISGVGGGDLGTKVGCVGGAC
ncbi:OPT oligopeptide transporter protein-domain-containing protein [Aspergillus keveii]|uniref:OPT oligopeptide transporter protein-domain-containing protein n=1 Tax=Aspergillus keveii TaxID=714993 RepID=A0ABR4FVX4_9EURO